MKQPLLAPLLLSTVLLPVNAGEISALQDKEALNPANIIHLEQNWSAKDRDWFYHINQGSRLLLYDVFIHLEQHDSHRPLAEPLNMMRFGFLPGVKSKANPDALPIGFARDEGYVGLTCAACHTQQLRYQDKLIRIDGGQPMLDLPLFLHHLEGALAATMEDEEKLKRLGDKYYDRRASEEELLQLKQLLDEEHRQTSTYNRRNYSSTAYGYSRLDAFGSILNKGLLLTGVKDNFNEPDAPTSYPYLWDTPQHDYVEWDGAQTNSKIGALARNVGEVIGVFGEVDTTSTRWLYFYDAGYPSSVAVGNLRAIEKKVSELHSPLWPDVLPPIDQALARAGRALYEKYCIACHVDIKRTDPKRKIRVRMSTLDEIKTDPKMARNAIFSKGKTGIFEGKPRFYFTGPILGEEEPAIYIVNHLMLGVMKNNPLQVFLAERDARYLGHPDQIHPPKYVNGQRYEGKDAVSEYALLAYKARPLNGIWTGAPYLHNGSVPNLYELLLPADERSERFYIGSWEFDPVHVGYVSDDVAGAFEFDTRLPGNSNGGHEYGTGEDGLAPLSEDEIWALVEYMKTL